MTTTSSDRIALIDRAANDFRSNGLDLDYWLDYCHHHREGYVFGGPDFLMMGWAQRDLTGDYAGAPGPFWLLFYARVQNGYNLGRLWEMMPFELPHIGFVRGLQGKKDLKYYPWYRLHRLCEIFGSSSGG